MRCPPSLRRHLSALINRDQLLIPLQCPSGRKRRTQSTLMSLPIWLTAPLPLSLDAWVYFSCLKFWFNFGSFIWQQWHFSDHQHWHLVIQINEKLHIGHVCKLREKEKDALKDFLNSCLWFFIFFTALWNRGLKKKKECIRSRWSADRPWLQTTRIVQHHRRPHPHGYLRRLWVDPQIHKGKTRQHILLYK